MTKEMAKEKRYAYELAYRIGDAEVCNYILEVLTNSNFHTFVRLLESCEFDKADQWIEEVFMRIKKEEEEKELAMIHNIVSDAVENLKNRGFHATESTGYYSLKTITEIYDEEEYEYENERCVDIFKQKDGEKEYYAVHVVYEDNETDFHYTEHLDAKELEELLKEIYE